MKINKNGENTMKKCLSVLSLLFIILATVFFRDTHTSAETIKLQGIKLNDLTIYTSFNSPSQKLVKKLVNDNETRIEISDKKTGKVIEALGEVNTRLSANDPKKMKTTSDSYSLKTIYKEIQFGPSKVRLSAQLKIYSNGKKNSTQIKSVIKTFWNVSSSENWYLNRTHSSFVSTTGTFPTQKVQITGMAVLEKKTIKKIKKSTTTDYYDRYPVQLSFNWNTITGYK